MTISTSASTVTIAGNGATAAFNFSFVAGAASNIVVVYTDASGVSTTLVQGSQYALTLNPPAGGHIWGVGGSVLYPLSGSPIAAGTYLTISRIVPDTQLTSISNQGDFYPQAVERALDTLEMQIQQNAAVAARAFSAPVGDPPGLNYTSVAAAERANSVLGFDAIGNVTVYPGGTVPAGTTAANISYLRPASGAVTRTAAGKLSDIVSILDFGADPTGVQASDSAYLAFIAAINAGSGGRGYVPAGTYMFMTQPNVTLAAGVHITLDGDGENAAIFYWPNTSGGVIFNYVAPTRDVSNSMLISNIGFVTGDPSGGTAITINGNYITGIPTRTTKITGCSFRGLDEASDQWTSHVLFNAVSQTWVEDLDMHGMEFTHTSIGIQYQGTSSGIATVHTIIGNDAYFLDRAIVIANPYIQGMVLIGNNFTNVNYGLSTSSALVGGVPNLQQISLTGGNQIAAFICPVAMSGALDCQITGNFLFLLAATSGLACIALDSSIRCQISGNDFVGFSGTNQNGVAFSNSLSIDMVDYPSNVAANTFQALTYAVAMASGVQGVTVGINSYAPGLNPTPVNDGGSNNIWWRKGAADSGGPGFAALITEN